MVSVDRLLEHITVHSIKRFFFLACLILHLFLSSVSYDNEVHVKMDIRSFLSKIPRLDNGGVSI